MALSYNTYTGDGATTNFTFTPAYINQSDVKVYEDGVLQTVTTDYTWFNSTTIQFNAAPANLAAIRFNRVTQNTSRVVDFQDASTLTESDLDLSANQLFFIAQEAIDDAADNALHLHSGGTYFDAETLPISNLLDPVSDQDAATKKYGETNWGGAAATAAAASAADAAAKLVNCQTEVTNCQAEVVLCEAETALCEAAKVAAQAAQTSAETVLDNFDDRYLGVKASDPTLDNDGNALAEGALYWNSTSDEMNVYTGSAWESWAWLSLAGGTMTGNLLMKSGTYTLNDEGTQGAVMVVDWTLGNKAKVTLGANCACSWTDPVSACNVVLEVVQDGTGNRTVTWPSSVKWPQGSAPTLSTGALDIDVVCLYWNGTNYYGSIGLNYF